MKIAIDIAVVIGVLLAVVWPLYLLVFRPVFRRLAFRQASRRPRETMLIVVGAMLGTALITGSLILGDGLTASIRHSAFTQLGPVDEVVKSPDINNANALLTQAKKLPQQDLDGLLIATAGSGAIRLQGDLASAEPSVQLLETDFAQAKTFGRDQSSTGIIGSTPKAHQVALSYDLASKLGAHKGDEVLVNVYGVEQPFRVDTILQRKGVAGLLRLDVLSSESASFNVFLPRGTMSAAYQSTASNTSSSAIPPPSALLLVSNKGGVINDVKQSKEVVSQLSCGLSRTSPSKKCSADLLALRPSFDVSISTVKSDLIRAADSNGKGFTQLFSALAAFSVVAGIFLLVTILIMLAQDRKSQHGVMRALGMTGSSLANAFYLEGWVYALLSSAVGAFFGVVVGRVAILLTKGIFSSSGGSFTLDIVFSLRMITVLKGFAIGFAVSLVTTLIIAWWMSRINIIRAIRDLPDNGAAKSGRRSIAFGFVVSAVGLGYLQYAVHTKNATGLIMAPALASIGLYLLLRRFISGRILLSTLSVVIFFWSMFGAYWAYPQIIHDIQIPFFIGSGLITVFATIMFLAVNQRLVAGTIAIFTRKGNLSTRIGFAYPNARRLRTGLILGMYSLVIFALAFVTIYSVLFSFQLNDFTKDFSAGYNVLVDGNSSTPFVLSDFHDINGVQSVAFRTNDVLKFRPAALKNFTANQAIGVFDNKIPISLDKHLSKYRSDAAAVHALLTEPDSVILDERFLQTNGGPSEVNAPLGSTLEALSPITGKTLNLKVIALSSVNFGESPAIVSATTLKSLNDSAVANRAYIKVARGNDPNVVAQRIQSQLARKGVEARTFRTVVNVHVSNQLQLLHLFQGYLALGLVIGIAGLGVVTVRSVRERRRQIGMLRSMGFTSGAVRRIFEVESAFIALEGILTGIITGTLLVWRLNSSQAFGGSIAFSIPYLELLVLGGVSLIASLFATAAPAEHASRIQPAAALRLVD